MSDDLIKRLRKRAKDDRQIQANNEVVASALRGQRLLFDQGVRSEANTFAVRLALDYERCAKNDANLAKDWDEAADRIEQLERERKQNGEDYCALMEKHDALHVKLAKAVAALRDATQMLSKCTFTTMRINGQYFDLHEVIDEANTVLAELEGGE